MLLLQHARVFFRRFLGSRNHKIQIVARVGRKSAVVLSGVIVSSFDKKSLRQESPTRTSNGPRASGRTTLGETPKVNHPNPYEPSRECISPPRGAMGRSGPWGQPPKGKDSVQSRLGAHGARVQAHKGQGIDKFVPGSPGAPMAPP